MAGFFISQYDAEFQFPLVYKPSPADTPDNGQSLRYMS